LAANACVHLDDAYIGGILKEYQKRRDFVFDELQKIPGCICKKPAGAFYIIAKLPLKDAEDFIIWMLKEYQVNGETVMTAPAEGFYATPGLGRDELRIAYILNEEDLAKAMYIFRTGLAEYLRQHA
jgi:aspartate aminotransferase